MAVYRTILKDWPTHPDNPEVQDRLITALERDREIELAMKEREAFSVSLRLGKRLGEGESKQSSGAEQGSPV